METTPTPEAIETTPTPESSSTTDSVILINTEIVLVGQLESEEESLLVISGIGVRLPSVGEPPAEVDQKLAVGDWVQAIAVADADGQFRLRTLTFAPHAITDDPRFTPETTSPSLLSPAEEISPSAEGVVSSAEEMPASEPTPVLTPDNEAATDETATPEATSSLTPDGDETSEPSPTPETSPTLETTQTTQPGPAPAAESESGTEAPAPAEETSPEPAPTPDTDVGGEATPEPTSAPELPAATPTATLTPSPSPDGEAGAELADTEQAEPTASPIPVPSTIPAAADAASQSPPTESPTPTADPIETASPMPTLTPEGEDSEIVPERLPTFVGLFQGLEEGTLLVSGIRFFLPEAPGFVLPDGLALGSPVLLTFRTEQTDTTGSVLEAFSIELLLGLAQEAA